MRANESLSASSKQIIRLFALHSDLAMPDPTRRQHPLGRFNDRIGVERVFGIQRINGSSLPETIDAERVDAMAVHATKPRECRRMSVDHRNHGTIVRQASEQLLDM